MFLFLKVGRKYQPELNYSLIMSPENFPKIYLYRRIVQAKLFIDKHFADPLNLNALADEAWFSKFHFIRLFASIYGKTPHQYLTLVRVEHAKTLLKTGKPVTEVCFEVGFESQSSFTALFKRLVHETPSEFQRKALFRQAECRANPLKFIPNCIAEKNGWTQNRNFQDAV